MVMQWSWNNIDEKDSKMVVLLTKVNDLEEKLKNTSSTLGQTSTSGQAGNRVFTLDDWHMKCDGNSLEVDGKI